ncbi:predicted protein [Naegleria gruberi]|uniref:Predicted protein n=1 Tax=Naegleria gruberi TaxID=5762 RepID=D2W3E8_NAEGR|nr:uncharacterized protein NAEGRDRAFT_54405 [Naegleria gruberi]EFC36375.1 predicted protein [Naegleria gruberi]|eukprot:XP_002669119.1 predicted protein [Naegleria gruberi strain NEG-M]
MKTNQQRRKPSIFYDTIFLLSDGYFFIDQVLPFFCFADFENLFLTCREVARLVSKQHHVRYLVRVNEQAFKCHQRWSDFNNHHQYRKREFPSLLHFADGIKIYLEVVGGLVDKVIEYCGKSNKSLSICYRNNYYSNHAELMKKLDSPSFNRVNTFGLLQADIDSYEPFLKLFAGKNVKKIELSAGYFRNDFISITKPILEKINFGEVHFSISGFYYSIASLAETLSKMDVNDRNKIRITIGNGCTITGSDYSSLKNLANLFQFQTITISDPPLVSHLVDCNFSLFANSYNVEAKSLTNIEDVAFPKFSNNKPPSFEMKYIELSLTPTNVNNFHVLHTTKYLTLLTMNNCSIEFSNIEKLELNLLQSLKLNKCSFMKNGIESNIEFIEWIDTERLINLTCEFLKLKKIPNIKSKALHNLKISNNEIETIDLETLNSHKYLAYLDLRHNKLSDPDNINMIVGKYSQLDLEGNPALNNVMIDKKKLEVITDFKYNTNRGSKVITRPLFSGTDTEIFKSFKSALKRNKNTLPPFNSKEDLIQVIENPKKLTSIENTNVIFWNNNYSNNQKSFSCDGNLTRVGKISSHFCQIAIHLNSKLQHQYGMKWLLFGFNEFNVEPLDNEKVMSQLSYIVHEWSFMSSHIEFVRELRRTYP